MTIDTPDSYMICFWYLYLHRGKKHLEILPAPMHDVCIAGTGH